MIEERQKRLAEAAGIAPKDVFVLSGAAGIGVDSVKEALWRHVVKLRRTENENIEDDGQEKAGSWSPV
jgi:hypothetical protein